MRWLLIAHPHLPPVNNHYTTTLKHRAHIQHDINSVVHCTRNVDNIYIYINGCSPPVESSSHPECGGDILRSFVDTELPAEGPDSLHVNVCSGRTFLDAVSTGAHFCPG